MVSTFVVEEATEAVQVNAVSPHNWPENLVSEAPHHKHKVRVTSTCRSVEDFLDSHIPMSLFPVPVQFHPLRLRLRLIPSLLLPFYILPLSFSVFFP